MLHKDIRIQFEIEDRRFEAIGFLNEGEESVNGDEMLQRTTSEPMSDEDVAVLECNRDKWPPELQQYYLTTGRRYPDNPRYISYFYWNDINQRWYQFWDDLGNQWRDDDLVVRHCA